MHVVFVCYYSFACNSAGHIACLANALVRQGLDVTVFVPFAAHTASLHGPVEFEARTFDELDAWLEMRRPIPDRTLLVAWTPRENVRRFADQFRARVPCRYVVHLEDNEKLLTAGNLGIDFDTLAALPPDEIDRRMAVDERLSHPLHFPRFVAASSAVTALVAPLLEFGPTSHPHLVFWPGYNPAFFGPRPVNFALRHKLGIPDDTTVLVYAGNVHRANVVEVRSLYLATCVLNRKGRKTLLIRTGEDYVPVLDHTLNEVGRHLIALGKLPSQAEVADAMAMADFFVQPGHAGAFNDYRFPSKLPEFFSIGRPVLLPASNLGHHLRPDVDAIVLQRGDAFEIAEAIAALSLDDSRSALLAAGARVFAEKNFQWSDIATKVKTFYASVLAESSPKKGSL